MKIICLKAGVNCEAGNNSSHIGKVTCTTWLFEIGFGEQLIMGRTATGAFKCNKL